MSREHGAGRWVGIAVVAVVGVLLAAGITYAASRLVSQPIGLPAQSGSLGVELAPTTSTTTPTATTRTVTVRTVVRTTVVVPPDDDGGGGGRDDHGGSGHGGDDD